MFPNLVCLPGPFPDRIETASYSPAKREKHAPFMEMR
jgi:hypothetical protein